MKRTICITPGPTMAPEMLQPLMFELAPKLGKWFQATPHATSGTCLVLNVDTREKMERRDTLFMTIVEEIFNVTEIDFNVSISSRSES